jgi:hypothetical protein
MPYVVALLWLVVGVCCSLEMLCVHTEDLCSLLHWDVCRCLCLLLCYLLASRSILDKMSTISLNKVYVFGVSSTLPSSTCSICHLPLLRGLFTARTLTHLVRTQGLPACLPAAPHALRHVFLTGRCWCLVRLEPRGSVETTRMKPLVRVQSGSGQGAVGRCGALVLSELCLCMVAPRVLPFPYILA